MKHQNRGKKVVFTNGCFDILHAGHVSYLEESRSKGDILVVAVNTDDSIKRIKGSLRPIISCDYRMRMVAALECVDYVVPFSEDTPLDVIELLSPDVLVKGSDYEISEIVGADAVEKRGGHVERIKFVDGLSTSLIIERIKSLN